MLPRGVLEVPMRKQLFHPASRLLLTAFAACLIVATGWADPGPPGAPPSIPKVGDTAADFTLDSLDGKSVKLSDLTAKGPVVLIVLRGWPGYQCPICTKQVGDVLAHQKDIDAAGAKVVLVYPGPADQLKAHAEEFFKNKTFSDSFRLLIDPDYKFTNAYGLRWDAARETAYPSTFVIDRQNVIHFVKVSKTHGDRASAADVVKALSEMK